MKGRILLVMFSLPFVSVGAFMGWSIVSNVTEALQMRTWQPVSAELLRAGYHTRSGDDSDSYQAYAEYVYTIDGRSYHGNRVAIAGGADSVGDHQRDFGRKLGNIADRGGRIDVYVDPADFSSAVIDRELRWGLLGFKAVFLFLFGGVGAGILIYALRSAKSTNLATISHPNEPWLANLAWQTGTIDSHSRSAMFVTWAFAAFWNLVAAPVPFLLYDEVLIKKNYLGLVGMLFPLVGVGLLVWALRRTLEWRRFGAAPVTLDPFPGAIGGHVGGTLDIRAPYDADAKFELTLTSVHSRLSGSGKNRKRSERAMWQDTSLALASPGSEGTRLSFRFDVPDDLAPSDATQDSDAYNLWRLTLTADLPGIDVNRDYEIPVYPTREKSRHLSEFANRDADARQQTADDAAVSRLVRLDFGATGRRMLYPAGRNLPSGLSALLFGFLFSGVSWFLIVHAGHIFMGGVFGFFGALTGLMGLYLLLNSLEIRQTGTTLQSVRRILGIPIARREMRNADFSAFDISSSMQSQSAGRHVMHYSVYAVDRFGVRMTVGEGFRGAGQAEAALRLVAHEFGLRPYRPGAVNGPEPLTASGVGR